MDAHLNSPVEEPTALAKEEETQARSLLERIRWGKDTKCPHCGSDKTYRLTARSTSEQPVRPGVWKCSNCRKQFTVTVGTIFERSHIPIATWIAAIKKFCETAKGITSYGLHKILGITYKSARYIEQRIRYALTQPAIQRLFRRHKEKNAEV